MNQPIPKDLAGRQLVCKDTVLEGDLIVFAHDEFAWVGDAIIGNLTTEDGRLYANGPRIYRVMPVASNLDHQLVATARESVTEEAIRIVCGDRNESYGNPRDDFARVAKTWSGLLHGKLKSDITPKEAILMMTALKLCREVHKPKRDTRVDIIGFTLCLDWVETGVAPN